MLNQIFSFNDYHFNMTINILNSLVTIEQFNSTLENLFEMLQIIMQDTEIIETLHIQLVHQNLTIYQILYILKGLEPLDVEVIMAFLNGTEFVLTDIEQNWELLFQIMGLLVTYQQFNSTLENIYEILQVILQDTSVIESLNIQLAHQNLTIHQILYILQKLEYMDLELLMLILNNTEIIKMMCNYHFNISLLTMSQIIEKIDYVISINKEIKNCSCECQSELDKYYYLYLDCREQVECRYPEIRNPEYVIDGYNPIWINPCVNVTCNGLDFLYSNVCNGHGVCIGLNECICRPGYYGEYCHSDVPC
jgi:hypothetical protein